MTQELQYPPGSIVDAFKRETYGTRCETSKIDPRVKIWTYRCDVRTETGVYAGSDHGDYDDVPSQPSPPNTDGWELDKRNAVTDGNRQYSRRQVHSVWTATPNPEEATTHDD